MPSLYTADERALILRMMAEGYQHPEIAARLGRTVTALHSYVSLLRREDPDAVPYIIDTRRKAPDGREIAATIEAYQQTGTYRGAARLLGVDMQTVRNRVNVARKAGIVVTVQRAQREAAPQVQSNPPAMPASGGGGVVARTSPEDTPPPVLCRVAQSLMSRGFSREAAIQQAKIFRSRHAQDGAA